MKKFLTIITSCSFLLQSCYSYKEVNYNDIKNNKNYEVKLKNGAIVTGISEKNITDSLFLRINANTVKFPKNDIEYIKRKKVSSLMVISLGTVISGGIIFLVTDQPESNNLIKPNK